MNPAMAGREKIYREPLPSFLEEEADPKEGRKTVIRYQ
jgi:hypothetical protein